MMMRGRRVLGELDQQIRDHIERETQDNIERGMSPDQARSAALRKFGSVALAREDARAVWTPVWLEQASQDARYCLRMLRRNPGFAAVAVLTLALGIGMTTAVFSVFNAVLLRPLAYPNPDRLIFISTFGGSLPPDAELVLSMDFLDWQEQATSFERLVAYSTADETLTTADGATRARIAAVSNDFWDLAGARPAAGRLPTAGEPGAVLLSHKFFERQFHGDPSVIGKAVTLDTGPATIVGVLPQAFRFQLPATVRPGPQPRDIDAYRPLVVPPRGSTFAQLIFVVARLKPDFTIDHARTELETIRARAAQAGPGPFGAPPTVRVMPMWNRLVGNTRVALWVLLAAVAFVLLIACANVANLLLARASARSKEMAIRTAVGAGRARILRQVLLESLVLAMLGAAAGLVLAGWGIATILGVSADAIPRLGESAIDGRVLAVALCVSVVTAVVFGSSSAISLWRANVHDLLKHSTQTSSTLSGSLPVRSVLVALELALAVVLLTGAGLMMKSFWRMNAHPPGFDPERILTMTIELPAAKYGAYADALLRRVESLPGVEAASLNGHGATLVRATVEGAPPLPPDQPQPPVFLNPTSAGLAGVMGLRVMNGRWITDSEPAPVAVFNESLARRLFAGDDPVGRRVQLGPSVTVTVVGVVADLKYSKLDESPGAELYVPYSHGRDLRRITLVVRTTGEPLAVVPALQTIVSGIDKTLMPFDVMTLEQALADTIVPRRFNLFLLSAFAMAAVSLALIGVYGVIAYAVAQRTHEIGVRMALGAERRDVLRMVVGQGMRIALAGIVVGLVVAAGLTRLMASLLYDVEPTDPMTVAAVAAALATTAFVACGGPALKAAFVDPAIALRHE